MSAARAELRNDLYPSRQGPKGGLSPRLDPVVHTSSGADAALDREQLASYERKGFVMLDGLFTATEIGRLSRELKRLESELSRVDEDWIIREPQDRTVRSIFRVHEVSPLFKRLVRDQRLVAIAEHVLGDRVYVHQSRLNYKPGFRGKEFYWHSDFETWHVEDGMPRMRALSISISLTENTPLNGALMLIPGSHRHYVRCAGETPEDHFRSSLRKQEYGVPDDAALRTLTEEADIETAVGPAGTTLVFDCNVMHGSNSNITPMPRSNVFIVFNSFGNQLEPPFGPVTPRPGFLAERDSVAPIEAISGPLEAYED